MRGILTRAAAGDVQRLSTARSLLAFDFDGTLAPLVRNREDALPRPSTLKLLARLSLRHEVAIITGRMESDIPARLPGVRLSRIVGNHGAGLAGTAREYSELTRRWARSLAVSLHSLQGVELENKGQSIAVHYRKAESPQVTGRRALAVVRALLPDAQLMKGNKVLNLLPLGAPDKGEALRRLLRESGAPVALFAGDDVTDEPAFAALPSDVLVSVRVGYSRTSAASYYLPAQSAIDQFLRTLLEGITLHQGGKSDERIGSANGS